MTAGYHAVYAKDYFEGIDAAKVNGFDFAQFDLGVPRFFLNELSDDQLREIRAYARDRQVGITFHAPGDNVSLCCDYPLIRKGILGEYKLILDKAGKLDARHVTFHAGAYPKFRNSGEKTSDFYAGHYAQILYENLKCLLDSSGDVLICVENFGWDEIKRGAIQRLMDERNPLYLTLDTGKLYGGNFELIQEDYAFFLRNKEYIREMHIHDSNGYGSHEIVGTGCVDFALMQKFYSKNVYLNFEIRPVEAARISRERLLQIWGEHII